MSRLLGLASRSGKKGAGLFLVLAALSGLAHAGPPARTPEIDAGTLMSGVTLLASGTLMLVERGRRK
jgi:hypothetical protein